LKKYFYVTIRPTPEGLSSIYSENLDFFSDDLPQKGEMNINIADDLKRSKYDSLQIKKYELRDVRTRTPEKGERDHIE